MRKQAKFWLEVDLHGRYTALLGRVFGVWRGPSKSHTEKKQLAQLQNEKQHDIQAHHKQTHKLRITFIEVVSQFFQIFWDKHSTIANP